MMLIEVLPAMPADTAQIRAIHAGLNRPARDEYVAQEFLIAWHEGEAVGCAGIAIHADGGYFYGLAVVRSRQRQGIGSLLMVARLDRLREYDADYAVALAMFWNSRFFRKHGFAPLKRSLLPASALWHRDISNPTWNRSAVMFKSLTPRARSL